MSIYYITVIKIHSKSLIIMFGWWLTRVLEAGFFSHRILELSPWETYPVPFILHRRAKGPPQVFFPGRSKPSTSLINTFSLLLLSCIVNIQNDSRKRKPPCVCDILHRESGIWPATAFIHTGCTLETMEVVWPLQLEWQQVYIISQKYYFIEIIYLKEEFGTWDLKIWVRIHVRWD